MSSFPQHHQNETSSQMNNNDQYLNELYEYFQ